MSSSTISKEHFKDGLKYLIVEAKSPDGGEHPLKYRSLGLLLLTGVIDGNTEDVKFALDNGVDVNMMMTDGMRNILIDMGWQLPSWSTPESSGAPEAPPVQSPESEERYPNG